MEAHRPRVEGQTEGGEERGEAGGAVEVLAGVIAPALAIVMANPFRPIAVVEEAPIMVIVADAAGAAVVEEAPIMVIAVGAAAGAAENSVMEAGRLRAGARRKARASPQCLRRGMARRSGRG